jgi:hypothetical protein
MASETAETMVAEYKQMKRTSGLLLSRCKTVSAAERWGKCRATETMDAACSIIRCADIIFPHSAEIISHASG